jgi:hypothetical protein
VSWVVTPVGVSAKACPERQPKGGPRCGRHNAGLGLWLSEGHFSKARSGAPGTTEVVPFPIVLAASLKRCPDTKLWTQRKNPLDRTERVCELVGEIYAARTTLPA